MRIYPIIILLSLALLTPTGCKKSDKQQKKTATPPTPPLTQLFGEKEHQAARKRLVADLKSLSPKKCVRPPLEGKGTAGSGSEGLRQLVEPKKGSPIDLCYTATRAFRSTHLAAFYKLVGSPKGHSMPKRNLRYVSTMNPKLPADLEKALKLVGNSCKTLIPTIKKVLQHERVCTPYLPGKLREPARWNLIPLSQAIIALQFQKPAPAPLTALKNLLLLVQLTQDMGRGGVSLLAAMVHSGLSAAVVPYVEAILREGKIPKEKLGEVWVMISRLSHGEPDYRPLLRAERLQSGMSLFAALDSKWQTPGGRPIGAHMRKPVARDKREGGITDAILGQVIFTRFSRSCTMLNVSSACISNINFSRKSKKIKPQPELIKAYQRGNLAPLRKLPAIRKLSWQKRAEYLGLLLEPSVVPPIDLALRGISRRSFYLQAIRLNSVLAFKTLKAGKIPTDDDINKLLPKHYDRYAGRMVKVERKGMQIKVFPPVKLGAKNDLFYLIDLSKLLPAK